jgi:Na+/H+ antiporter NhaD/arsenite permease-like protein
MWRSIIIFAFAYVIIASGRMHKAVAALLAGCLLIALGGVSQEAAYREIDLNVIFLLLGMMILVGAIARTGFFQWVAIGLAKRAGGNPLGILVLLVCATAFLSAFLDNVTTILLMAPVTILIADELELDPTLFLVLEVMGSNIGGTATLIGDPPNLLIGSRVGLTFNEFILNLAPAVVLCTAAFAAAVWLLNRRRLYVPEDVRARIRDADPGAAITDRREAVKVGLVLGGVLLGFFLHDLINVEPSVVALGGAMVVLVVTRRDVEEAFHNVEWTTLMFFVGLFILVAGLDERGVLAGVASWIGGATKGHLFVTVMLVMWGSAAASSLVDNIPFVAAMIPVMRLIIPEIGDQLGIEDPALLDQIVARPLWWALALGACMGGNGTLVGASANVVMAGVASRHGHEVTFGRFARYGLPTTAMTLAICSAYIYVRYFAFASPPGG